MLSPIHFYFHRMPTHGNLTHPKRFHHPEDTEVLLLAPGQVLLKSLQSVTNEPSELR